MRLAPFLACSALILGCQQKAPPPASPTTSEETELTEADILAARLSVLEDEVTQLQTRVTLLGLRQPERAIFSPEDATYSPVATSVGTFLVSLHKVVPYADGQRLTFRIGNPQSVQYRNPTVRLKWGKRRPELAPGADPGASFKSQQAWEASLQSKEERLLRNLHPGAWNEVTVTVAPASSEDVGHVEFTMEVSMVSMTVR